MAVESADAQSAPSPLTLPVLPLDDAVVLPGMVVSLDLSDAEVRAAVEAARAADGADGFVYTTDWNGRPVVRARMHWVVCEAIAAAYALGLTTGEKRWYDGLLTWWRYAQRHLVDADHGSWHHELSATNEVASRTWEGKPDVYHALQMCLLVGDTLPLAPSFATALAARRPH